MNLVNEDGSITPHDEFIYQGKRLKVVMTNIGDYSVWSAIDSVKNLETNKITEVTRRQLHKLNVNVLLKFNIKK